MEAKGSHCLLSISYSPKKAGGKVQFRSRGQRPGESIAYVSKSEVQEPRVLMSQAGEDGCPSQACPSFTILPVQVLSGLVDV